MKLIACEIEPCPHPLPHKSRSPILVVLLFLPMMMAVVRTSLRAPATGARTIRRRRPSGRRCLRHAGRSGLNNVTPVVNMLTPCIKELPCLVPKPALGLLEGGNVSALLVRRGLRGESGRVLRIYEHAAVVCAVTTLVGRVASIAPRVACVARWMISMDGRISSSCIRGGSIVHWLVFLVLLSDRSRLAGTAARRRDRQEGLAGGRLLVRSCCWLSPRVFELLSMVIAVAALALQAVPDARLDTEVRAEVERLVVICRVRHGHWYATRKL